LKWIKPFYESKEKLSAFEQKANNRFELTEKFLKYNIELANESANEEKLHLHKKAGSNFQIKDRTVFFEPRGAWKNLLDSGIFDYHHINKNSDRKSRCFCFILRILWDFDFLV